MHYICPKCGKPVHYRTLFSSHLYQCDHCTWIGLQDTMKGEGDMTKQVGRARKIGFIQGVIKGMSYILVLNKGQQDGVDKAIKYLDELFDEHKGEVDAHKKEG